MGRIRTVVIFFVLFAFFVLAIAPSAAQTPAPVDLGNVNGTIVTLYYYNNETVMKGAIVPLPDGQNPQPVEWDSSKSAPGTYTFYKVPFGIYYVEAVHGNHSYFAIVNVSEGTATANVAIPPDATDWKPVASPSVTPSPAPSAFPSPSPSATASPTPSPGMTTLCALVGLTLVTLYVVNRKTK